MGAFEQDPRHLRLHRLRTVARPPRPADRSGRASSAWTATATAFPMVWLSPSASTASTVRFSPFATPPKAWWPKPAVQQPESIGYVDVWVMTTRFTERHTRLDQRPARRHGRASRRGPLPAAALQTPTCGASSGSKPPCLNALCGPPPCRLRIRHNWKKPASSISTPRSARTAEILGSPRRRVRSRSRCSRRFCWRSTARPDISVLDVQHRLPRLGWPIAFSTSSQRSISAVPWTCLTRAEIQHPLAWTNNGKFSRRRL